MSTFSIYGTGQGLGFALLSVGLVMCCVGAGVPYWMRSEVSLSSAAFGLAGDIPFVGNILDNVLNNVFLLKINLGVWVLCLEYIGRGSEKCYNLYIPNENFGIRQEKDADSGGGIRQEKDADSGGGWILMVRFAVSINLALGLICGLAACCRCMCCSGGRTICHGILSFLAGGFGIGAVAIMADRKDDLLPFFSFFEMEYNWAFYVYAGGCGSMLLASILLCFSMPNEMANGAVIPAPMVGTSTRFITTVNPGVVSVPVNQLELNNRAPPQPWLYQTGEPQPPSTPAKF